MLIFIGLSAYNLLPGSETISRGGPTYLAQMDSNFVVWMLICAVLVLFMQAGFLLLEAGVVRSKNSINVAQKNSADFVISGVVFFLFGFQLIFGLGESPFFGFGGIEPMQGNASALVVMIYQFGFCATAATIVSGAVAERMKFGAYLFLAVFMAAVIYPMFAHLVWGNAIFPDNPAYLADIGFIDFAGSTVVHTTAGWVALAAILVLGARKGRFDENGKPVEIMGHSSVLAFLGTIILLIGWVGFNAGAVKPEAPELPQIIANTIVAASFGATAGMVVGYVKDNGLFKPMATMTGLLGGLVAITAAVSVVSISGAALVGMIGGIVAILGSYFLTHVLKLDDPLDVVAIHGLAGIAGTLLLVVFGDINQMVNVSRMDQFIVQLEGIGINFLWSFGLGYTFLKLLDMTVGIRVSEEDEIKGLNSAEHGATLGIDKLRFAIDKTLEGSTSLENKSSLKDYRIDIEDGEESSEIAHAFNSILDKHTDTIIKLDQMTKEANAASEAKSEFLATMSHEIRTPMNGVMGMAEILNKTDLDKKQRSFVNIIMTSGSSLLGIINDILDFSKIQAGKMQLDQKTFDLHQTVGEITQMLSPKSSEKLLELIVRIQPDLPQMFVGDMQRIRQMLVNLTGNAIKFTEVGHILIDISGKRLEDDKWTLHFKVIDTGIGIPEEKIDSVFEKFSQVDSSTIRKHDGTGLGLAITSTLASLMDGKIGVSSKLGEGSEFWFEITLQNDVAYKPIIQQISSVKGKRVLVVDDNKINQKILAEQLSLWETEFVSCNDGPEAIAFLDACQKNNIQIDAMILDYHMPEMNGEQLLHKVRAMDNFARTPVMLLTSVDYLDDGRLFSHLGFQAVLNKPALSNEIFRELSEILNMDFNNSCEGINAVQELAGKNTHHAEKSEEVFKQAMSDKTLSASLPAPSNIRQSSNKQASHTVDVLIAEDNEINQVIYAEALKPTGLSFRIVENGEDALHLFQKLKPTVICMDVSMPIMDGLIATQKIRNIETEKDMPPTAIIGITAHALNGDREKCLDSGMDDYLSKPISPDALVAKIMSWRHDRSISYKA